MEFCGKQKGFILLTLLIFISLIVGFSVQMLTSVVLALRLNANIVEENHYFQLAEQALKKIEQQVKANTLPVHISFPPLPSHYFVGKDLAEWQRLGHAATLLGQPFYYSLELLEQLKCQQPMRPMATQLVPKLNYYRITVFLAAQSGYPAIALQSTFAQLEPEDTASCPDFIKIRPGRQSWREISAVPIAF